MLDDSGQSTQLPPNADVSVGADGSILADGNQVAQLQVVDFAPGTQLTKVGNGMFTAPNGVTAADQ